MAHPAAILEQLSHETVWYDQHKYEEAELEYQQHLAQQRCGGGRTTSCNRETKCATTGSMATSRSDSSLAFRISTLEDENKHLRVLSTDLESVVKRLEARISALECGKPCPAVAVCPARSDKPVICPAAKPAVCPAKPVADDDDVDDEDFELFKDDEEDDAEAERVKQERVKAYEDKKAKKPVLIAKSNIILDIKPWDDETDMAELERSVRTIEMDGLLWGSSKLVPLAYTIKKLQISCVVEDDKVSTDDLEEKIMAFEDLVQSVDIAAFNKI